MIKTARQLKDLIRNLSKKNAADAQILMRNYTPPEGSVLRPAGGFLRKADDCPQRSGSCQSSQGKLHFPCAGCRQLPLCGLAARKHFALQAVSV